jgi:uncharacterized protein YjbI with pentapeptide repeats
VGDRGAQRPEITALAVGLLEMSPRLYRTTTNRVLRQMSNPEHLQLLREGVDMWNAWRSKQSSISLDLSGVDLSGVDLTRADLKRVDLAGANIWKTSLREADLRQANLRGVDLTGSVLVDQDF